MDHNPTPDRVPAGAGDGAGDAVSPEAAPEVDRASERVPAAPGDAERPAPEHGHPAPGHGGDHHGQDHGRTTVTVGQAQHAMRGAREQDMPAMSQNNASVAEKLAGIIAQTRADLPGVTATQIGYLLRERAAQAGLHLEDDIAAELADEIAAGG